MHKQWSNSTKIIIVTLCLIGLALFVYFAAPMFPPLFIAILLAYLLEPAIDFLKKRTRLPHEWAVPIVFLIFLALLITGFSFAVPTLIKQIVGLSDNITFIETELVNSLSQPIVILGQEFTFDPQLLTNFIREGSDFLSPALEDTVVFLEVTSTGFVWALVVIVSCYYFLLDWQSLHHWFVNLAPRTGQEDLRKLAHEIDEVWRAYVRGTLVLMLIMGVVFTIGLAAIGFPNALVIGLVTGLLIALPEIGPLIAGLIAVVIAYFQGSAFLPVSNLWFSLIVVALYILLSQIRVVWLQPRLINRFIHIHPGVAFIILIATFILQGAVATLFIIPLLATFSLLSRFIRCKLLNIDPWPSDTFPSLAREIIRERPPTQIKPAWLEELEEEFKRLKQQSPKRTNGPDRGPRRKK